jgi:hypothetical protein
MTASVGFPISSSVISGLEKLTARRCHIMLSTAISRIAVAALFAISTTAAATGSDKPPRFLTVPVLGLRVPLDRLNLDQFPEDIRAKCDQLYVDIWPSKGRGINLLRSVGLLQMAESWQRPSTIRTFRSWNRIHRNG